MSRFQLFDQGRELLVHYSLGRSLWMCVLLTIVGGAHE